MARRASTASDDKTDAWVLYIDLYGFSAQVSREGEVECFDRLNDVVLDIRQATLRTGFTPLILSDSIFVVAQTPTREDRDVFRDFYNLTRDIQDELIDRNFLPRGGVAFGQIRISDRILVGRPVIAAVRVEQHISLPCVFLPAREKAPIRLPRRQQFAMPTKTKGLVRGAVILPRTIEPLRKLVADRLDEALLDGPDTVASDLANLQEHIDAKWSSR